MTRDEIINLIEDTFGTYATKIASKTDVEKGAYLPNKQQRDILTSIGIEPIHNNLLQLKELFSNNMLTVSYYPSERIGSGRNPEIRMGQDIIRYINIGDEILFTHDQQTIFIYNLSKNTNCELEENIHSQIDIGTLQNRARNINPRPQQVQQIVNMYPRNNILKNYVKKRSNYSCEMPNCNYPGFQKENGVSYIEVHHVIPLSEGVGKIV